MEALKGKGVEIAAFAGSILINSIFVAYVAGKLEARVAILEQLRVESRVEVSSQLAEINRKVDRILERSK